MVDKIGCRTERAILRVTPHQLGSGLRFFTTAESAEDELHTAFTLASQRRGGCHTRAKHELLGTEFSLCANWKKASRKLEISACLIKQWPVPAHRLELIWPVEMGMMRGEHA